MMKKNKLLFIMPAFMIALVVTFLLNINSVHAASGYKIKGTGDDLKASNGRYEVFIKRSGSKEYLIRKDNKTNKNKTLKKLPATRKYYENYTISAAYGDRIYLNYWDVRDEDEVKNVYVYFANTNKLKKVLSEGQIIKQHGKYMVSNTTPIYRIPTLPTVLYKSTKSGLKKIKVLTKYGMPCVYLNSKYVYYTANKSSTPSAGCIYREKLNGTGKKKIKSYKDGISVGALTNKGFYYKGKYKKY